MTSDGRGRDVLAKTIGTMPDCIPLERLGEARTDGERAHLESCARCQAELALWHEFEASTPSADDGAAVRWIAAETARRRAPAPSPAGRVLAWWRRPGFAAAMATLVLVVTAGYLLWDPEPLVRSRQDAGSQVYRSAGVQATAPLGDVATAPRELRWTPVGGAASYDVGVLEVDRTALWTGSTSGSRIDIPAAVSALFVPGKTILWEVKALDGSRGVIGESGPQQFRVAAARPLRKP